MAAAVNDTPESAVVPNAAAPIVPIGVAALQAISEVFGLTPEMLATDAGAFIGAILRPIVKEEIAAAFAKFSNTAEIGVRNEKLQADWDRITNALDGK